MAQAVQLFNGVVKFPAGKVFSTQYGDRTNAVITLDDGSEAKLWGNPTDATLLQLMSIKELFVSFKELVPSPTTIRLFCGMVMF